MIVPEGWRECTIGDIISIKNGFAFKSSYFINEGFYKLMTPGHFFEEGGFRDIGSKQKYYNGPIPKGFVLKKGDLLIALTEQAPGLLASSAIIPEQGIYLHNQRLGLVSIKNSSAHNKFVYHLFNHHNVRKEVSTSAGGTKVKHTSSEKVYAVPIFLPPIDEQKAIAAILSTWDRAIEKTEALVAAKERRKQGLMQQLLTGRVRFGEFVKSAGKRKTSYYDLPEDWQYPTIGEVAKQVSVKNTRGAALPVLSCTKHAGLVDSLAYFGKQIFSEDLSTYKVVPRRAFAYATNHIEEGSIGFQDLYKEAVISPMYTVFKTTKAVHDGFLFKLLKTEWYRHIFEVCTSASVDRRGSLRWKEFAKIRIPLPGMPEQEKVSGVLDVADGEIQQLKTKMFTLKEQKKGLMQQLLTGKVRVKVY